MISRDLLATLIRRGVVTTSPTAAQTCCGSYRDDDGFCIYRPGHPIYVKPDGNTSAQCSSRFGPWEEKDGKATAYVMTCQDRAGHEGPHSGFVSFADERGPIDLGIIREPLGLTGTYEDFVETFDGKDGQ